MKIKLIMSDYYCILIVTRSDNLRFIGNKTQMLEKIEEVLLENNIKNGTFCDIFSGTGTVGEYFKDKFDIISNDILYFSYVLQWALIKNNKKPELKTISEFLGESVFTYLNNVRLHTEGKYKEKQFFIKNNYSPKGNRMYFTEENAHVIDLWRLELEEWKNKKMVSENEYYYILACIIETIPFYSNISGTYGAFLKKWDPRALKPIELLELDVKEGNNNNHVYNEDGEKLIKKLSGDILYIDPPYNSRQYLPNYHVLETIAKYDYPNIKGVTGIREYSIEKSRFASKVTVEEAFRKMIANANFRHIVFSYNTDGLMSEETIIDILSDFSKDGECKVYRTPYKRFKSRKLVNKSELYELIFYIEKDVEINKKKVETNKKKTENYIKSPLNYIGGKYKLLNQILAEFPTDISTFVDLFAGGLNVGINVKSKNIIAIDTNKYIMDMFRYFKTTPINIIIDEVYEIIDRYELSKTNREGYLKLRESYNQHKNDVYLFVLSSYSFNHQIRFNNKLEFNCPFGNERSSYNPSIEKRLKEFVNKLHKVDITFKDFDFSKLDISKLDKNSFVYCDPPYLITNGSYNDGTRGFGDWTDESEKSLLSFLDKLNDKNIKFALSNVFYHKGKENKMLIEWSKKYNVIFIDSNYNNSNYQSKARKHITQEVLIKNY